MSRSAGNTVAFTGYRPKKLSILYKGSHFEQNVSDAVKTAATECYSRGKRFFLCGMAEGFDLLAARAILELQDKPEYRDAKIVAVVPFAGFELSFDDFYRDLFDLVLDRACDRVIIAERYSHGCFNRRNDYLTDNASTLICCYDGQPGGTAYTVRRAKRRGLGIYNILNPPLFV